MGLLEDSIRQIIAEEFAKVKAEIISEFQKAYEDRNSKSFIMNTEQIRDELGLSYKTIIKYDKLEILKPYEMIYGGPKYYKRHEVYEFLNSDSPLAERIRNRKPKNHLPPNE